MSGETAAPPGGTASVGETDEATATGDASASAAGRSASSDPVADGEPDASAGVASPPRPEATPVDATAEGAPKRKRRRRRRKKKAGEQASPDDAGQSNANANAADVAASVANLAGGLFSHLDDREIVCRLDGCNRTWVWTADEQIRNFGQPPPRRVCSEHAARMDNAADKAVPCANPGCDKTWLWTKRAQAGQLSRKGPPRPPVRACDDCQAEEKTLADTEAPCKVEGCKRTWTWSRDAQLKHRAWLRHSAEGEGEPRAKGRGRGRRRKKARGSVHEPPPRMCAPCRERLGKIGEREGPCKVHGCTRMAKVDRDTQLRAWVALNTTDTDAEPSSLPRRMCEVCREFCKHHPDRAVACGRPTCDKTWTFKTGAQLQAFLAGRLEDPVRLCSECSAGDFAVLERPQGAPAGAEVMPCVVLGCDAVWYWLPGTRLASASPGEEPSDRMCAAHRASAGAPERAPMATAAAPRDAVPSETSGVSADAAAPREESGSAAGGSVDAPVPGEELESAARVPADAAVPGEESGSAAGVPADAAGSGAKGTSEPEPNDLAPPQ